MFWILLESDSWKDPTLEKKTKTSKIRFKTAAIGNRRKLIFQHNNRIYLKILIAPV